MTDRIFTYVETWLSTPSGIKLEFPAGLNGLGGLIWYLGKISYFLNDEKADNLKKRLVDYFYTKLTNPTRNDIEFLSGNVGTLTAIMNSSTCIDKKVFDWIEIIANEAISEKDFSFSHGSGCVVNLVMIAKQKYNYTVINYEKLLKKALEWAHKNLDEKMNKSWCKGSLSTLLVIAKDKKFSSQVKEIVKPDIFTRLSESNFYDHSLCHGYIGYVEIFMRIRKLLGSSQLVHESLKESNIYFRSGLPNRAYNIGLFNGISGFIYLECINYLLEDGFSALYLE